jgi:nucleoside-diphosphate-sugar epimerase
MKALVTGATGFIGSHLVEALIKRDWEVTCLVRRSSDLKWIEHLDTKYIFSDLSTPGTYKAEINGFDYIFHVAGLTKAVSEQDYFISNTENTRILLQVVHENNPDLKRFVFLSSLAAAGPSSNGIPVTEETLPAPVSSYGRSKLEGEKAVLEYKERLPVTIIRPPAVYGPRDNDFLVLFRAIKRGIFPYWGKCSYSLLYVEDLVDAILLAAEKKEAEGEIFFLSDGRVYTNDDIAREIASALSKKACKLRIPRPLLPLLAYLVQKVNKKGIINPDRINDFRYSTWTCDLSKAEAVLGYNPERGLREGMQWTADWYRIHQWL